MKTDPAKFQGRHESVWNPWVEGLSSSTLGLWLKCREQFRLEMVEGWRNESVPLALAFGTCMHWCLERLYQANVVPADPKKWAKKRVSEFEALWKEERPGASQKQLETQERVYGLAEAVLPAYVQRWAGDFPGGEYPVQTKVAAPKKWAALETRFKVWWTFSDGKQMPIVGTRDGLFRDKRGKLRVFDTKCRSIINEEDTIDLLPTDLQQMLYLWSVWSEFGEVPAGTTMNIVRRPGHRQGTDESLKEFCARVAKEVSDPKRYDHYFMRFQMDITLGEIESWRDNVLGPILEDFRAWWEGRAPHYLNPEALVSKYGRCAMFGKIVFNNNVGLYRRKPGTVMKYQTDIA